MMDTALFLETHGSDEMEGFKLIVIIISEGNKDFTGV